MAIEIREHVPGKDIEDFLRAGRIVFEGDRAWVPPLDFDIRARLTPGKSPFFLRGELALFTAWKDGRLVGRISAQLDHEHLRLYDDRTGFFGFFDTVDDPEVGKALVDAAAKWLARRGMTKMRGPLSLTMNEEVGVLIEGFEHPPAMMMSHSRRWQDEVARAAGLEKARDLYAWRFEVGKIPERANKAWAEAKALPEVKLRSVEPSKMQRDLRIILDVFNDAWKQNWGYVPPTEEEAKKMAEDLRFVLDKELSFIAEVDGKPVGICICLPNLNEVIRDFDGKLNPITLAKLIWRLKVRSPKSGRLVMLGIKSEMRNQRRYAALSHALYVEVAKRGEKLGYEWGELSWTLEDNRPINLGIKSMGATIYKKYRVYEKAVSNGGTA
jgi:hypothetical protein